MRAFWLLVTVLAVGYTVASARSPVSEVSLGCSKVGDFGRGTVQCSDSIVEVYGVSRLVLLGVFLSAPPLIAAISMRRSIWWGAVVALGMVGLAGLIMWTSFWILLLVALPLAFVGTVAVLVDTAVRASKLKRSSSQVA